VPAKTQAVTPGATTTPGAASSVSPEICQSVGRVYDSATKTCVERPPAKKEQPKSKGSKGARGRNMSVGRELMAKMKQAAKDEGVRSWRKLPRSHPARANFRAWYAGKELPHPEAESDQPANPEWRKDPKTGKMYKTGKTGAAAWKDRAEQDELRKIIAKTKDPELKKQLQAKLDAAVAGEEKPARDPKEVAVDGWKMYDAMKGAGTDEEAIYALLKKYKGDIKSLYNAFDKTLKRKDDTDSGDLIDWLRDDGEDKAALFVKKAMMTMKESQMFQLKDSRWIMNEQMAATQAPGYLGRSAAQYGYEEEPAEEKVPETTKAMGVKPAAEKAAEIAKEKPAVTKPKSKGSKGASGRDPAEGRRLMKAMKQAAKDAGKSKWSELPSSHPARVAFRKWYKTGKSSKPAAAATPAAQASPQGVQNATMQQNIIMHARKAMTDINHEKLLFAVARNPNHEHRQFAITVLKTLQKSGYSFKSIRR